MSARTHTNYQPRPRDSRVGMTYLEETMDFPHLEYDGVLEVIVPALEAMAGNFTGWELAELCHALNLDERTARDLFDVWLERTDTAHLVVADGLRYYYVSEDAAIYGDEDGDEGVCAVFPEVVR